QPRTRQINVINAARLSPACDDSDSMPHLLISEVMIPVPCYKIRAPPPSLRDRDGYFYARLTASEVPSAVLPPLFFGLAASGGNIARVFCGRFSVGASALSLLFALGQQLHFMLWR